MDYQEFLEWEEVTWDTHDFKTIYVDLAGGNVLAGLVLSELMFWHLPDKTGKKNKLRVKHDGKMWIAIRRYDWWKRARLSPDQADKALMKLVKAGLIEKKRFKFWGEPTVHIRVIEETFLQKIEKLIKRPPRNPYSPKKGDDTSK